MASIIYPRRTGILGLPSRSMIYFELMIYMMQVVDQIYFVFFSIWLSKSYSTNC